MWRIVSDVIEAVIKRVELQADSADTAEPDYNGLEGNIQMFINPKFF